MSLPKVWLERGVMWVEYPIHCSITLDYIEHEYRQRIALSTDKFPLLVKLNGMTTLSVEAQRFWAGPQYTAITRAAAIVINPDKGFYQHSKTLLDMFASLERPAYALRQFDCEAVGLRWLTGC